MLKIDDKLLTNLGLNGLSTPDKNLMLSHIYETLELRVGERLTEMLSDTELYEFEGFFDSKDDDGALAWLERTFPDYRTVVHEEFEMLKQEISTDAARIVEEASTSDS